MTLRKLMGVGKIGGLGVNLWGRWCL